MADQAKTFTIEDAKIVFRNFEGKEGQYNKAGDRNFSVLLDPDIAAALAADGWNVKMLKARDEESEEQPYITISVSFDNRPPRVVLITSTARTPLTAENIAILDWADIRLADLIARGYDWSVNGKTGTKAYLQTLFVTIEEDELERKYAEGEFV